MKRKLLVLAISGITALATTAVAGSLDNQGSTVTISKGNDSRIVKPYMNQRSGQNGYLNPANNEDFAIIMEHVGYANTTPKDSPMFFKMVQEARKEALMQPSLYSQALKSAVAEETLHHSLLAPKRFEHAKTNETRTINSSTVNVTGISPSGIRQSS